MEGLVDGREGRQYVARCFETREWVAIGWASCYVILHEDAEPTPRGKAIPEEAQQVMRSTLSPDDGRRYKVAKVCSHSEPAEEYLSHGSYLLCHAFDAKRRLDSNGMTLGKT